jgi:hypothetical protein
LEPNVLLIPIRMASDILSKLGGSDRCITTLPFLFPLIKIGLVAP